MVVGSIVSQPATSVTTGSEVYIKGGSVQTYNPVGIGSVLVTNSITATTGSEVYVKGGSIQTYNPLGVGSIWFGGGIGSVTITNSLPAIGSYTTQTISGTVTIDNRVAGSIVNMPIVGVSGTLFAVSGIVNQGTTPWGVSGTAFNTVWVGTGSVLISGTPNVNVSTGSVIVTNRMILNDLGSPSYKIATAIASGTYTQVWAPIGGSRVEIHGYHISTNLPGIVRLANSGTTPDIFSTHYLNFASGAVIEKTYVMPIIPNFIAGSPIGFQTTSAGSTSVTIYGREVA